MNSESVLLTAEQRSAAATNPSVEIVIPVYNERRDLDASVRRLHSYLVSRFPFSFRVTIADNASTDDTWTVAERLAFELPHVRAAHLEQKGRGRALRAVWSVSDATVVAYMDVDLSTDLDALLPLVAPLLSGHSDVAIGSRLHRQARVVRGPKREVISRGYNLILRAMLAVRFSDAQCGFKAIRTDAARALVPLVVDEAWFFDTELLVLAERAGLRIHEVPVDWTDDPDSRVDIVSTALADLKGVARITRGLAAGSIPLDHVASRFGRVDRTAALTTAGQAVRFAVIGVASTLAYLLLYTLLRGALSAQLANATALAVTAVANTAANRRVTFGVRGRQRRARHHAQGLAVFALALAVTSASLAGMHAATRTPGRALEVAVLVIANLIATCIRFVLLRRWVFANTSDQGQQDGPQLGLNAPPQQSYSNFPATDQPRPAA